ncbi:lipoprotein [Methylophilus sp. 1]|jgi:predicted small lipoprotein YifL|uniref:LPS translocon maturation chaperone LptM n=1 Tax=unclassified Methylophilus TaxID=2630143 RepID=UPI00351045E9
MVKWRTIYIGRWIMLSFWTRLLAVALLLAQLSACGLKGDLYIPERQYPQTPQQDKSSS